MIFSLPTLSIILSLIALAVAGYCLWLSLSINRLRKTFFAGNTAKDLESVIESLQEELKHSLHQQLELENALVQLKRRLSFTIQKVGLIRFNPFSDGGGNFSFSLALMDEHNSGVVVTSMHGREQNRIYSKKITEGKSEIPLTEEEEQAIILAHQKNKTANQD